MKFFVPGAESPGRAEEIWNETRAWLEDDFGKVREGRVFRLDYRHHAKDQVAEVGETDPEHGRTILAIFCSRDVNYVCTVAPGLDPEQPSLIRRHETYEVEYFE
jgi:hypothetical protein